MDTSFVLALPCSGSPSSDSTKGWFVCVGGGGKGGGKYDSILE